MPWGLTLNRLRRHLSRLGEWLQKISCNHDWLHATHPEYGIRCCRKCPAKHYFIDRRWQARR